MLFMGGYANGETLFCPVYTNRNDKQYRCTGVVEGSCPWETVAYFTRLSDGWSLAAHGPQIYEDGTIEWNYSTGGHWPQ